jgi:hypothetical protein
MYEIAKLFHLLGAVVFGGVLFVEVVLLPVLKKEFGEDMYKKIEKTIIQKRGIKIVPFFVLILYLSGFYMFHYHVKSLDLSTSFGKLLILKVFLAILILVGVISAIVMFLRGKSESKIFDYIHIYAFALAFCVIILAKLMFIL